MAVDACAVTVSGDDHDAVGLRLAEQGVEPIALGRKMPPGLEAVTVGDDLNR